MADSFNFELVSPERLLVSEEISQVVIPGTDGEMTVMANHAPVMSTIKPGVVSVTKADGQIDKYVVFGGFADIMPTGCTLLAESATHVNDLDKQDISQRITDAKEDLADASDDAAKTRIGEYLDHLTTLEAAV